MSRQNVCSQAALATLLVSAALLSGCGGTIYAVAAIDASNKLDEAKAAKAEKYAPYEYTYAHEHMIKAQQEASQGDYGDAIDLAEKAEEAATNAIKLCDKARRGEGR